MKRIKISFLFFIISFFLYKPEVYSQVKKDSTYYYYQLLKNPKEDNDLISSYLYFDKQKELNIKKGDTAKAITCLSYIASIENKLGAFYDSESSAVKALNLLKNKDNIDSRIGLYNHIGMVNRTLKNYDNALFYYNKLLLITKTQKQNMAVYNNRGVVYQYQKKYNAAIGEFKKAYQISLLLGDSLKMARSLDNLGYSQSKIGIDSAYTNMKRALIIRQSVNKISELYPSYKHLTSYFLQKKDTKKAFNYASKSYELAKKINSPTYIIDALSNLSNLSNDKLFYEYKNLTDSISIVKQVKENKFASIKYDFNEQKRIANENKIEQEKQKRLKTLFLIIGIFILLISIAIYQIKRIRHKKEKIVQVLKTEGRISKKVHDEVANDLYQAMTKLQSNSNSKEDVLDDLENVYNKARDISRENNLIEGNANFNEILNDLFASYKNDDTLIITKELTKVNWNRISVHEKNMLYRIFQELMTNMKKYSKATMVTLTFQQKNRNIAINYNDNGVGCDLIKKNGLLNTESRMKSIDGKISFDTKPNKGFKVNMII
jgi:tetratricopeptide (TPR) repeat protein